MAKPELKVVVLGDSAMWGEGLLEKDKFSTKSVQEIGKLLGCEARIIINSARCGAAILAGRTEGEQKKKRDEFADTYGGFFNAPDLVEDFIQHNNQEVTLQLHQEIPAMFPTVSYQVERIPDSVGQDVDMVLLNGGANDLDFQELLSPKKYRQTFVNHYDPLLEEITYLRVKSLLRQARKKFPAAVLVYTGYFSPFAPNVSNAELKKLFEHESREESWKVAFNRKIEVKAIGPLVKEAQFRAQFAASRGLHWQRKAVGECNADPQLRGPGVLFVHPQFGPENTVFGSNSFFHRGYRLDSVVDPMARIRHNKCPRRRLYDEMERLINLLLLAHLTSSSSVHKDLVASVRSLLEKLDGPRTLLSALGPLAAPDLTTLPPLRTRVDAREALNKDLKRINHARRASFIHPNEKGAQQYSNIIVKRYKEWHYNIRLRGDLLNLQKAGVGRMRVGLRQSLSRYGFGAVTSVRAMTQLMLVDSIALKVVTAANSAPNMSDNIFLNLGGAKRWQLNFPRIFDARISPQEPQILDAQFKPGTTDFFTIDARGTHLGSIKQFTLESQATEPSQGEWQPSKITLYINGVEVFSVRLSRKLPRNGTLTFPYPQ